VEKPKTTSIRVGIIVKNLCLFKKGNHFMKKVKIMICSVLVLGAVAGSLAFKAKDKAAGFYVFTKNGTVCPIASPALQLPTTTTTAPGATVFVNAYTTSVFAPSVATSLCTIPTITVKPE
jgi:hypothetical protein